MDTQLLGRAVLVTGGSSGIGRATAIAFGREGARVALSYRSDLDAADRVAAEVEAAGGEGLCVPLDLSEPASIESAVEQVVTRLDGLDVLVANAVRWPHDAQGALAESDPDAWERALRANLEGTARTVRAAWPALAASGTGRVVLVSTGVTRTGIPGSSAYATAKAGLEGLASALKWEGAETGILINTVAPGFTVTERNLATFGDEVRETVRGRTPSGRLSVPDDVAAAIVYLGSPANGNITGGLSPGGRWHRLNARSRRRPPVTPARPVELVRRLIEETGCGGSASRHEPEVIAATGASRWPDPAAATSACLVLTLAIASGSRR